MKKKKKFIYNYYFIKLFSINNQMEIITEDELKNLDLLIIIIII